MDNEYNFVTLLEEPLCRVDFSRLTFGDYVKFTIDNLYVNVMLAKCCVDDMDAIPIEYALVIVQKFGAKLSEYLTDVLTTRNLLEQIN